MDQLKRAALELRLNDLKTAARRGNDLSGCLLAACSAHDPDPRRQAAVIRFLVKSGVPLQETDKNGVTPLHRAVRFRNQAAVKLLLVLGAEVNATDRRSNSTPLHRAVTNTGAPATAGKHDVAVKITQELLSHGADPRAKNKQEKTPADYAKRQDMQAIFKRQV